jgi:hypothetical protein
MARKPLRSQLNQIRAWVRQGRTDAWIAHQLDVSTAELREFRRRHELDAEAEGDDELDLRDEIEAEIEATMAEEDDGEDDEEAGEDEEEPGEDEEEPGEDEEPEGDGDEDEGADTSDAEADDADAEDKPKRRRRRRGGRGRSKRSGASMEATFDHGDDGYGLWLDPAIADDPVYAEHWAGHREVEVAVEPDRIVIRRTRPPG